MSVRFLNNSGNNNTNVSAKTFVNRQKFTPVTTPWVRNASWPVISANSGDNKIVGLYAVYPGDGVGNGGNFFAMTNSGAYTIDYGDGTATNYASGTTAYYEYNYNNSSLSGTDAPVTFTATTSTVNRTAHGYSNGDTVRFYNIVTTTGISENTPYYVVNSTANTFQVSTVSGGSVLTLTNDGSATLLPYKIAVVTIAPQAGQNLTSINFYVKHNQSGLANGYSTGWLDIEIALPSCTTLTLGSSLTNIRHLNLEQVKLNQLGAITSFANLFSSCYSLRSVGISASTAAVANTSNMFNSCYSLLTVPLFNTVAVTNMSSMFNSCYSLLTVPLFNTEAVTTMQSMFSGCRTLLTVPLFNTVAVTNMSSMFNNCFSLTAVPALGTTAVNSSTNLSSMFTSCNSLARIQAKNFRWTFSVANCKLSATALNEIYTNLPTVTAQTITVSGNYGTATDNPSIATAKGWTVTG